MSPPLDLLTVPKPLDDGLVARPVPWLLRHAIVLAGAVAVLLGVLATALALAQPWMGLRLQAQGDVAVIARVEPASPAAAAGVPGNATLLALVPGDGTRVLRLEPADLIEDPDMFGSYAEWGRFYQRQDLAAQMLHAPALRLWVRAADGRESLHVVRPAPTRALASLPFAFWFQLLVPVAGMVAAGWALSVYPLQPATGFAAAAALAMLVAVMAAAVFSTRELALPSALMHALSTANHAGSLLSQFFMAGAAAYFPLRLGPRGLVAALFGIYVAGAVADSRWWLPSPNWAQRAMLIAACALTLAQLWRQWRACADLPRERALVRALVWPWVLGLGCLLGLQEIPMLLGLVPPLGQSWALGSTLILTVGSAVALRSQRSFDLDDWALQLLLVWGGAIGVLACYQLIRAGGWLNEGLAMLAALALAGLLYTPLANWVWRRVLARRGPSPRELTSGILVLGLSPPDDRMHHWADLLRQTFHARHLEWGARSGAAATTAVAIVGGGTALSVPPVAGLPGMMLWHKDQGARLFSRSDCRLAERLLELARRTIEARDAYGRGAAEERARIADDLHDDLGAKLLSLAHASTPPGGGGDVAALAREALDEMRLAVRNLKAQPAPLHEMVADWRAESVARLRAASIAVDWEVRADDDGQMIPARVSLHLARVLREAITNVIRHSGASQCRVRVAVAGGELHLQIEDNGRGLDAAGTALAAGMGLPNIERRARRLGGTHRLAPAEAGGLLVAVRVPLA
ncbi:ATP-binding protein, partial [Ottowia sp.]|uniref:sensor histidine kinase n=1 Tax=Ottowia sp. TaxID=1898956 RepID=UPI0039E67E51